MSKNYVLGISFLFLLISQPLFSQVNLKGSLKNNIQEPISFANVVLLNAEDSTTVYRGAVSNEDGDFSFKAIEENRYLLRASFMGYKTYSRQIEVSGETNLGELVMQEAANNLDEVTLEARRPKITKSIDRITFDVENTSLSTGTTYEVLKKTPGVIVVQGNLIVKNQPAVVYINDRKVYLSSDELRQLLEGFSAENIKSVEVITTPPAKYDAEGGAILNIKTSKNISIGYKGSVNASNTIAVKPKYTIGTSHYYKNDWVNVFASYNFSPSYTYKKDEGFIEYYQPNGAVDSRWNTNFRRNTKTLSHNFNTILDFNLNKTSSLSISANIQLTPKADSDIDGRTDIYNPEDQLDSLFTTNSRLENDRDNILLSATYTTDIGENGASLSAIANYINYDDNQTQDLLSQYFLPGGNLLQDNSFYTLSQQNSDIYTGQVDLSSSISSLALETGVKYSGITSNSGLDFFDTNSGSRQFIDQLSDEFDYNENIYAAYFSLSKDWEKWSLKGGLRGEYTDVEGNSASLGAVNTQEYFELFPTFYLMYSLNEKNSFSLDYSRRIVRPRFQSLNPYRYFLNENNFQEGNPNLKPAISNKINLNYTHNNSLSFDLYWERANNATAVLPFQDNQNRNLRSVNANMDFDQQFSLDISYYAFLKDWWTFSTYNSIFYYENEFYAYESGNHLVNNHVTSIYSQIYNLFTLSKDRTLTGEVITSYAPDFISGSYDFGHQQFSLSLSLRKTFFDNRLTASINADDILNTSNIPLESQYLNQNNSFFARPESRRVRFGVIYKFGNFKLRDNQRAIDAAESERLEEKGNL